MYDRKTWVVLAICGALLALNFHYASKNQRAVAEARAREEALQQTKPAIEPASRTACSVSMSGLRSGLVWERRAALS